MRTREEQIEEMVQVNSAYLCHEDYTPDNLRMMLAAAISEAEERAKAECAAGYIFHSPDTGTEILPYHPVESGECTDATDIRLATADVLKAELLSCWEEMANSYREQVERGAECAADTRRLEWLEKTAPDITMVGDGWGNRDHWHMVWADFSKEAPSEQEGSNLRAAIDAAMEGGK